MEEEGRQQTTIERLGSEGRRRVFRKARGSASDMSGIISKDMGTTAKTTIAQGKDAAGSDQSLDFPILSKGTNAPMEIKGT